MDIVISASAESTPDGARDLPYLGDYYHQILACLGYPLQEPPVADLLRQMHHLPGTWLVVSPIVWEASHNDAKLVACGRDLGFSAAQGLAWFELFADFAQQEFAAIHYHDPYTWLVQVDTQPTISAQPVQLLRDQSMLPHLTGLGKCLFWQRFLTETQMLLSQHDLNQARNVNHRINGVWIWGAGDLQPVGQRLIVADTVQLLDLARLLSSQVLQLCPGEKYPKTTLVLLDQWTQSIETKHQKVNWYWQNCAYQTLSQGWLQHLWSRLW